ncbi:hypothetical protein D3C72_1539640 [compost metagenome]
MRCHGQRNGWNGAVTRFGLDLRGNDEPRRKRPVHIGKALDHQHLDRQAGQRLVIGRSLNTLPIRRTARQRGSGQTEQERAAAVHGWHALIMGGLYGDLKKWGLANLGCVSTPPKPPSP